MEENKRMKPLLWQYHTGFMGEIIKKIKENIYPLLLVNNRFVKAKNKIIYLTLRIQENGFLDKKTKKHLLFALPFI